MSNTFTAEGSRLTRIQRQWFIRLLCCLILLAGMIGAVFPHGVSAHAGLLQSVPAANDELKDPPDKIVLTFNERLEEGVFYIKVFDSSKKQVTNDKAQMSADRLSVELKLPQLGKGSYIVTYHVISADGHPVEGTYLFAVGQSLSQQPVESSPIMEHMHPQGSGLSTGLGFVDILQYISRILYYIFMLAFTGWLLWMRFGKSSLNASAETKVRERGTQLQQGYLLAFLFFMFTHLFALIGDGGTDAFITTITKTSIGYVWLASLALSLLSFVMLHRSIGLDLLWVVLIWLTKSFNGHAAAFQPLKQTILLDVIHLGAAAIWVGGVLMLLYLWSTDKAAGKAFFPRFSGAAFASIVLLTASGILTTFVFLPNIEYVLETNWGKLLLVKSGLVVLVVLTAGTLRWLFRKREDSIKSLLRIDALLALLIAGIVGVFTYMTPLPANTPLNWHDMGETIHMTTQISPTTPGVNDFTVKVWLPEKLGKPKQVILKLQDDKAPDIAPLEVPLVYTEDNVVEDNFGGLKKHTYKARGPYLPYPGYWNIEVRVMDSNDDEKVYKKQIRVF
ncbi:copper resistance CopC/CopD family protein [Paenibacillus sp. NPDC056579]|uniref:copper resistance CopC/CopD family protein n=1 Tax=Paenibacillus sp. NPDC056579 TaxID=3345871 RepID=UPI00369500DB